MSELVVWKFHLSVITNQTIRIPIGADLLGVQVQDNRPVLYALVDQTADNIDVEFVTLGTGHLYDHNPPMTYVGTYIINDGSFAGHVFMKRETENELDM